MDQQREQGTFGTGKGETAWVTGASVGVFSLITRRLHFEFCFFAFWCARGWCAA